MTRKQDLIYRLQQKRKQHQCIVAAGVSSLSHVKCCQNNHCDLILFYPTAKYANASNPFMAGYLAFGNTNSYMQQTLAEIMPFISTERILLALNGSDPFKMDPLLLRQVKQYHAAGIHNYPAMTLVDGDFGSNIDSLHLGFHKEIELLKKAAEENLFTCAMVRTKKQAIEMAKENVDLLIFYLGLGEDFQKDYRHHISSYISKLQDMAKSLRDSYPNLPLLFYDERVSSLDDIKCILHAVPEVDGYCLLPVTKSIQTEKQLALQITSLLTTFQTIK